MENKTYIWGGIIIGGILGGILGSMLDNGNMLGLWSIILSGIGSILGIFVGYRLGNY